MRFMILTCTVSTTGNRVGHACKCFIVQGEIDLCPSKGLASSIDGNWYLRIASSHLYNMSYSHGLCGLLVGHEIR